MEMGDVIDLLEVLLGWPVLAFIGVFLLAFMFRKPLGELISRVSHIELSSGERIVLSDYLEQDLSPLSEAVDVLKQQVEELQVSTKRVDAPKVAEKMSAADEGAKLDQMKTALRDSRFTWRSIERLALAAGLPEKEAHDLLSRDSGVKIGKGKSGRIIAKLKD